MRRESSVRIDRVEEDYFLRSQHQLNVNRQPKSEALLADGDVIELGKRCRGTFRLPSATTSTAMLEFNGASFPTPRCTRCVAVERRDIGWTRPQRTHPRAAGQTPGRTVPARRDVELPGARGHRACQFR